MNQEEELIRSVKLTELIGLGEAQREIYDSLNRKEGDLLKAYELHQRELEFLIKYRTQENE